MTNTPEDSYSELREQSKKLRENLANLPAHAVTNPAPPVVIPGVDNNALDALRHDLTETYSDLVQTMKLVREYELDKRKDEAEKILVQGELNVAKSAKIDLENQVNLLNQSIDESDMVISAMNVLTDKQYETIKAKDDQLYDHQEDIVTLTEDVESKNAELTTKEAQLRDTIRTYEQRLASKPAGGIDNDQIVSMRAKIYDMNAALTRSKTAEYQARQRNIALETSVSRLSEDNAVLSETVAQDAEGLATAGKTIQEKDRLLAEERDLNANLNRENSTYLRRVRNLSDALGKEQDKVVAKDVQIANIFKNSDNLINRIDEKNAQIADKDMDITRLQKEQASDLNTVGIVMASKDAHSAVLIERLGEARKDYALKQAENAMLKAKICDREDDILNLEETVVDNEFDNHNLNIHIDNLESDMAHNHERFDSWEYWAGLGGQAALKKDYNDVLFNFAQAMNRANGNVNPYLNFGSICLNMLEGNMADDAIERLSDALTDCKLSRKDKRKVLELRADLYRFNGQRKEAIKDWKTALGGYLGWITDVCSGSSLKRQVLKNRIKELAP